MTLYIKVNTDNHSQIEEAVKLLQSFRGVVSQQDPLFSEKEITNSGEGLTDKQYWFLKKTTSLTDDEMARMTRMEGVAMIADIKSRELNSEPAPSNSEPLPWERNTLNVEGCSFEGCTREAKVKGMCAMHYQREYSKSKKKKGN